MSSWCEIILIRCWIGIRGDHLRNKIICKFFLKFWKIQWKIKTFTNLLRQTSFVVKLSLNWQISQVTEQISVLNEFRVRSRLFCINRKFELKIAKNPFCWMLMGTKRFFESVDYLKHLSKYSIWRGTEKSRISNFLVMNDAERECNCIVGRWSNQNRIFPGIVLLRKNSFQLKIPKSVVGNRLGMGMLFLHL